MNDRSRVSRRTILRGAGVALALPWLESLAPRGARGQAAASPGPFIAMSFPCGASTYWWPQAAGAGDAWSLSSILAPLAPVKPWVNVLGNVGNYGPFGGPIEPSNSYLTAALLTCTKAVVATNDAPICGTSVDQVIAKAIGGSTKLASMQVGLSVLNSYLDGLPAACSRSISWRSPTDPTFKLVDPQAVFDQIVGAPGALAPWRSGSDKSVLDFVTNHAATVRGQLGTSDRTRLDQFLDSVRALEAQVQVSPAACVSLARPTESIGPGALPADYDHDAHANLMIDLVVMALACDVTRVVSFMLDDARSDYVYDFLPMRSFTATTSTPAAGKAGDLQGLNQAGDSNDGYSTINLWFVEKLARLCQKLLAIPSAGSGGTMLDDATIWFGSEMHGGNNDGLDLPIVTAGKGGGRLKTNQYVDFAQTTRKTERLANLYLTFMRGVFGLADQTFGTAPAATQTGTTPANAFGAGTTVIPEILA